MLKTRFSQCLFAGFIGLFAIAAVPAKADVYTFDVDHCSPLCGNNLGTVTVTQDGTNTVKIDVEQTGTGFKFVNSASHGDNFLFDIGAVAGGNADDPTISVSNVTSGWKLVSPTAGSLGGASWSFEYAMTCDYTGGACDGSGGSKPANPPLIFDVTAAGLTPESFEDLNGNPVDFAADVIGNSTGKTGLIGATYTSGTLDNSVPEPTSVALLAGVLMLTAGALRKRFA